MSVRVLLVDDICLYRESVGAMLADGPWDWIVGTASDAATALRSLVEFRPDVVLLSMATISSFTILRAIVQATPPARVIVVGVSETEDEVIACAESGVAGYLLRSEPLARLGEIIQSVTRGETLCSPRVAATLLRRVATLAAEQQLRAVPVHLTARESEILRLIELGMANREIAQQLCIEERTVKNHVHNILEKLHVRRRGEAVAKMRSLGWTTAEAGSSGGGRD